MKLTMAAARDYINTHPEHYLKRDRSGKGFICPLCNNGSGSDGDGLRLNKKDGSGTHYKCFKCGAYGDVVEFIAQEHGIDGGSGEAFKLARQLYDIELIPEDNLPTVQEDKTVAVKLSEEVSKADALEDLREATKKYLRQCHKDLEQGSEYLKWRELSLQTAARYGIGYDIAKCAVVIPTTTDNKELGYVLRYTSPGMKIRYENAKGLSVGFFNLDALMYHNPVFVVEGWADALSILQMGFSAVSLNSGANVAQFIELVNSRKNWDAKPSVLLIAMDNDEAGQGFSKALLEGLQEAQIPVKAVDIAGGCKDANELLMSNPERLRANLNRAVNPATAEEVDAHKVGNLITGFRAYVQDGANNRSIPTGFRSFDKAIGGGLFPKLYMIGAISSLGKTTFCLQMADAIAAHGRDVLVFSLEMSKEDIMARSISRHTYLISQEKHNESLAKTELGIVAYERYSGYSDAEKAVIGEAYKRYTEYAEEHISIYEGKHTAEDIRRKTENYINFTGHKPIIFIDYLQIVQPQKDLKRATVREQIDDTIDVFTAMRRELKIPVIVVSSFNRNNYNKQADMTAFKESGGIEYSADCVITLELDVKRNEKAGTAGDSNEDKAATLDGMRGNDGKRSIKLTFQKNRGNRVGSTIFYRYDARFNYFEEDESKPAHL